MDGACHRASRRSALRRLRGPRRILEAAARHGNDRDIILPDDFVVAFGRPHLIQIDPKSHAAVPHPDDVLDAVRRATETGHPPIAVAIDTVFRSIGAGNVSASDQPSKTRKLGKTQRSATLANDGRPRVEYDDAISF